MLGSSGFNTEELIRINEVLMNQFDIDRISLDDERQEPEFRSFYLKGTKAIVQPRLGAHVKGLRFMPKLRKVKDTELVHIMRELLRIWIKRDQETHQLLKVIGRLKR